MHLHVELLWEYGDPHTVLVDQIPTSARTHLHAFDHCSVSFMCPSMDAVGVLPLFFSFCEISGFFILRLFKLTFVTLLCLQSY